MQVRISPQDEAIIQRKLDAGHYSDPSDVIHEALLALEEREQLERLHAALAIGENQAQRGEYAEWTPDLKRRLREEADEMARQGVVPDSDVCP